MTGVQFPAQEIFFLSTSSVFFFSSSLSANTSSTLNASATMSTGRFHGWRKRKQQWWAFLVVAVQHERSSDRINKQKLVALVNPSTYWGKHPVDPGIRNCGSFRVTLGTSCPIATALPHISVISKLLVSAFPPTCCSCIPSTFVIQNIIPSLSECLVCTWRAHTMRSHICY